ncbi:VCBS repeat-containing protein [Lutibacter sp.]|uniref:VCBS repeat-containing protein n=1 Tax=Lutibacter sp. TaxID=1925666 RepID=UPI002733F41F|nr:VCBS repeat-containing protein [Lutibacter sp.]MDP3313706.1 VCBS repeat-containing protein [Lutibacter sp.]
MITFYKHFIFFVAFISLFSCDKGTNNNTLLKELTAQQSGVDFTNELKDTPELNILTYLYYYNGAGIACADFNNDGLDDLYFIGNQKPNKFYLNKGNLKFEDVTKAANLEGEQGWSSGVTIVDINNDGLLDIYVCQVNNNILFKGENQLYINQGIDTNGIPYFKDEAKKYQLNFASFSNQATFFDFDLDGDLDMFLMKNESVHPSATFGRYSRFVEDAPAGDKLLRNDNGVFTDVTKSAGIFSSLTGYGLGLAISDFNQDGWPDIYIGNDFLENDYMYINQQNGTFKDQISKNYKSLGHTAHFSMGNDVADFNNDGYTDILSVDMLPEDRVTYTSSGTEYQYQDYLQFLKNGYAPQYMQNTLHVNLKNGNYSEIGFAAGITATEWSWAALFADFDNDGFKDIFIANGIYGATNNMDFIHFISDKEIQKNINKGMTNIEMDHIKKIPQVKTADFIFKNKGDLTFEKMNGKWFSSKPTFSNGAVYVDLDNDGDLDLVVNKLNEPSSVYENTSTKTSNYLKVKFKGNKANIFGIGAKVKIFTGATMQYAENFTTRGYLSTIPPNLHFGLGNITKIDSLHVIWPDKTFDVVKNVKSNQSVLFEQEKASGDYYKKVQKEEISFIKNVTPKFKYKHFDYDSYGFVREPLVPFMLSNLGPKIAVADVNNDGLDDVFICGAKQQKSMLFIQQKNGMFLESIQPEIAKDIASEDSNAIFIDADNDNDLDLIVVGGGDEFQSGNMLKPRLYKNNNGIFKKDEKAIPTIELNASVVISNDFDSDGDLDLFMGSNSVPTQYGKKATSYLLENKGNGIFIDVTKQKAKDFLDFGSIHDAVWTDVNKDGFSDLIVVGHWLPITVFLNDNGKQFIQQKNTELESSNGLWNSIVKADFDNDGDDDYVVGNWGQNSVFKASKTEPMRLYLNDFDANGKNDPIITYYNLKKEILFATKDDLFKQIPKLQEKFLGYNMFAKADLHTVFSSNLLKAADKRELYNLNSSYVENLGNGKFKISSLPTIAQWTSVYTMLVVDFNNDGFKDVLMAGNIYEVNTQLSRLDASHGVLLLNNKKGQFYTSMDINRGFSIDGPARSMNKITIKNTTYYVVGVNNESIQFLQKK